MVNQHHCSVVLACTCASQANLLVLTMTTDASLLGYRMTLLGRKANKVWSQPMVHLRDMVPVPPRNPCRGISEQGSRPIAQGNDCVESRGLFTGEGIDLEEIWPGRGQSVHLSGIYSMLTVFLSLRHEHAKRPRCSGPPLAKCSAVCLSASQLHFPNSGQRSFVSLGLARERWNLKASCGH